MGKNVTDPLAEVSGRILVVRGQRVMLDADLARLYGDSTKVFNQAVRRNRSRFPGDFLLERTNQEVAGVDPTSNTSHGVFSSTRCQSISHECHHGAEFGVYAIVDLIFEPLTAPVASGRRQPLQAEFGVTFLTQAALGA